MTEFNDLILIYQEGQPLFYARVDDMIPDPRPGFKGWFTVEITCLTVPVAPMSIGLNYKQVYEAEPFTMAGKDMLIEYIPPKKLVTPETVKEVRPGTSSNVVSLADRRK